MRIAARQPYYKCIIIHDKTTTIAVKVLNVKRVQSHEIPDRRRGLRIIYIIITRVYIINIGRYYLSVYSLYQLYLLYTNLYTYCAVRIPYNMCPYGYRGSVRWKFKEQTPSVSIYMFIIIVYGKSAYRYAYSIISTK